MRSAGRGRSNPAIIFWANTVINPAFDLTRASTEVVCLHFCHSTTLRIGVSGRPYAGLHPMLEELDDGRCVRWEAVSDPVDDTKVTEQLS